MGTHILKIKNMSSGACILMIEVSTGGMPMERRFDRSISVLALKERLTLILGASPESRRLTLKNAKNEVIAELGNDAMALNMYDFEDYATLYVEFTEENSMIAQLNNYENAVEKYEMPDEVYDKRENSVRAIKARRRAEMEARGMVVPGTDAKPEVDPDMDKDEPTGKNNGSVEGVAYFECDDNYGIFKRASFILPLVGDYPELDPFASSSDDEM